MEPWRTNIHINHMQILLNIQLLAYLLCWLKVGNYWFAPCLSACQFFMLNPSCTSSHLWFTGVHDVPLWCSVDGAVVTVHKVSFKFNFWVTFVPFCPVESRVRCVSLVSTKRDRGPYILHVSAICSLTSIGVPFTTQFSCPIYTPAWSSGTKVELDL